MGESSCDRPLPRPKVSVVMSVYNAEATVGRAIESILAQTFGGFELVLINDGSKDNTGQKVSCYKDSRIRFFQQENSGLGAALNRGVLLSRGEYIARMDADDISLPNRLEMQVEALERDPDCALLGAACYVVDSHGKVKFVMRHPTSEVGIRWLGLFDSPFVHSTVIFRRTAAIEAGLYSSAREYYVEDFDLWSRVMRRHRVGNLSEPLVCYHDNPGGISHLKWSAQTEQSLEVSAANISFLLGADSEFDVERARAIRNLRTQVWPGASETMVMMGLRDLSNISRKFLERFASNKAKDREVWAQIERDAEAAWLNGAYLIGLSGDRGACARMLFDRLRGKPDLLRSRVAWKALCAALVGKQMARVGPFPFGRNRPL